MKFKVSKITLKFLIFFNEIIEVEIKNKIWYKVLKKWDELVK